jgi:flagellar biosynthesis protein FliP
MPSWLSPSIHTDPAASLSAALPLLLVGILPLALVTLTCFAKVAMALSALKSALGAQDLPSAAIVSSVALALSLFIMAPVAADAERAWSQHTGSAAELGPVLITAVKAPLVHFLDANTGAAEKKLFTDLSRERAMPLTASDLSLLWPSFVLSELKQAFTIGFSVAVPFLVLDLIVAHTLLALGLNALPVAAAAFPLKLLLFVSVDGFQLLGRALVLSYH